MNFLDRTLSLAILSYWLFHQTEILAMLGRLVASIGWE